MPSKINYPKWRGLTGKDADLYHMISGIYGDLSGIDFESKYINPDIRNHIIELYFSLTTYRTRIALWHVAYVLNKDDDDNKIDDWVKYIDFYLKQAKRAISIVNGSPQLEILSMLIESCTIMKYKMRNCIPVPVLKIDTDENWLIWDEIAGNLDSLKNGNNKDGK